MSQKKLGMQYCKCLLCTFVLPVPHFSSVFSSLPKNVSFSSSFSNCLSAALNLSPSLSLAAAAGGGDEEEDDIEN